MRAGQFNRRRPKNLIGRGDRPANEFNVDFKEQRHLPSPQYSGKKARQRKLLAEMMVSASALYSAGSRSARLQNSSNSRRGGAGGSTRSGGSGRTRGGGSGSAGSGAGGSTRSGGSSGFRGGAGRAAVSRSRNGRMRLARERSLDKKQRRDGRREEMKRTYRRACAMLVGVILLLGRAMTKGEAREAKQSAVQALPVEVAEHTDMISPADGEQKREEGESPAEGTADSTAETAPEAATDHPAESPEEGSAQGRTESPAETPTEQPAENTRAAPTEQAAESPAEEAAAQPTAVPVKAPLWTWDMDTDPPTAKVKLDGVGTLRARVTYKDSPARCTKPGKRTYTARAEHNGRVYTDTKAVTLPALGHSFGDPQMTTDSSGNTIIRYTCSGCNQTFEITFQAENE